jgi:hypothetical protein
MIYFFNQIKWFHKHIQNEQNNLSINGDQGGVKAAIEAAFIKKR